LSHHQQKNKTQKTTKKTKKNQNQRVAQVLTANVPDMTASDARAAIERAAGPGTQSWAPLPAKVGRNTFCVIF
jgi:hypothetical protein